MLGAGDAVIRFKHGILSFGLLRPGNECTWHSETILLSFAQLLALRKPPTAAIFVGSSADYSHTPETLVCLINRTLGMLLYNTVYRYYPKGVMLDCA